MRRLIILPGAQADLDEHLTYVLQRFGPEVAQRVAQETDVQLLKLCLEPLLGKKGSGKYQNRRYYVLHRNLSVVYKFDTEALTVLFFWNNHRNPAKRPF